jgi:hypothetical protein
MRSSIRGLMGVVSLLAFGLLAVRGATPPDRWLVTAAVCLFGLIGLLTASARRPWRSALAVFAGVGSLYLALCFGPGIDLREVEYLPSTPILDRLFSALFPRDYVADLAAQREYCSCHDCVARVRDELQAGFLRAGHVVSALLAAALSGLAAWALSSYRKARFRGGAKARPNEALKRTRSAGR